MVLLHVLLIITLVMVFSLAVANLGIFHYQAARRQELSMKAAEAAQAGLSDAVRQLSNDPRIGTTPVILSGDLDEAHYEVRFGPAYEQASTNNLSGFLPVSGWNGRTVPPHAVHLLAIGTVPGGGHRVVEALAHLEALPFPVQSTGTVTAHGLTVAGASAPSRYETDALPGSIYSGNNMLLDGIGAVTGDLRSVGTVNRAPSVLLSGQTYENVNPLDVPNLNISDFDNYNVPGKTTVPSGTYSLLNPLGGGLGVHRLQGTVYVEGDLHIIGPLLLDSANVFVANGGNLTVEGPITGKGSIFVTGKAQLQSGALVNDDEQIAVFADSDLEIKNGLVPLVSLFQGVLYSHSKIKLGPGVTVLGAVISRAYDPTQGNLEFDGLNQVVHIPQHTAFASYWLARGTGGAPMKLDYWAELP